MTNSNDKYTTPETCNEDQNQATAVANDCRESAGNVLSDNKSKLVEWEAAGYRISEEGDPDSMICGAYETGCIYASKDGKSHLIGSWGPMSHENYVKSMAEIDCEG